jgi:FkbM family methyltransferase
MSVTDKLKKMYLEWRRQRFPPSIADIHWRHEFVATRLEQIERAISKKLPETASTPALQAEILTVLRLLEPKKVVDHNKTRVGSVHDGGYVQVDDLEGISHALSFGVSDNDSWDLAMAEAGIPVEQFDHSVDKAPSSHPLLHFHRKMISVDVRVETATLPDLAAEHSKLSTTPDLILKMDIEGCEWEVFDQAPEATLSKFSQIMCEFHDLSRLTNFEFRARARRVFEKLDKYFAPVHIHGNNCRMLCNVSNIPLPDVLEITFASRGRYFFEESNETYPTPLDAQNDPNRPDLVLGTFKF